MFIVFLLQFLLVFLVECFVFIILDCFVEQTFSLNFVAVSDFVAVLSLVVSFIFEVFFIIVFLVYVFVYIFRNRGEKFVIFYVVIKK